VAQALVASSCVCDGYRPHEHKLDHLSALELGVSSSSSVGSRSQTASNSVVTPTGPRVLRLQLQFDVRSIGLLLIAPNILCTVCSIAAGLVPDSCIVRGVNVTVVRKVFQTVSQLIPAVATILIGYLHSTVGVIAITLAVGLSGRRKRRLRCEFS